ncbi:hypothetical protein [Streptomyces sp. NPDC058254]|uniref:hypothetical protein n=1 Tax=Streptomyces sp. NPDC058254 TaxID=3346406 RepID=UPI0036E17F03
MTDQLTKEIAELTAREIHLAGPYPPKHPYSSGLLRMVFMIPFGHAFSLMCNGPMGLHDLINRTPDLPAVAERALAYDCLTEDGNALLTPNGEPYRSIENPAPVATADVVGVSVINAGDLHSVLRLLDLAGIPRRSADRIPGVHPLVVGGNQGLADPEPLADYLDVVAIGEAERSLPELLRIVHAHRTNPKTKTSLHEQLARVPGLYVPSVYSYAAVPGGGVEGVRSSHITVPHRIEDQRLPLAALPDWHFVYPISDGSAAGMHPTVGCRHACLFCNLGIPPFRHAPLELLTAYVDKLEQHSIRTVIISSPTFTQYKHREELLAHIRASATANRSPPSSDPSAPTRSAPTIWRRLPNSATSGTCSPNSTRASTTAASSPSPPNGPPPTW